MTENKTENEIETSDAAEENEPVYYSTKHLSLIADASSIISWFVLVGFVGNVVVQGMSLQAQLASQGLTFSALLKEVSFFAYIFSNLLIPLLTGLGLFAVLQAVSIGLNVMFEMDFNAREPASDVKG